MSKLVVLIIAIAVIAVIVTLILFALERATRASLPRTPQEAYDELEKAYTSSDMTVEEYRRHRADIARGSSSWLSRK